MSENQQQKQEKQEKQEKQKRTVPKCSCGYKIKGPNHNEGEHHKKSKPMHVNPKHGIKTNIGDALNR